MERVLGFVGKVFSLVGCNIKFCQQGLVDLQEGPRMADYGQLAQKSHWLSFLLRTKGDQG
jgi:hypothetical protein